MADPYYINEQFTLFDRAKRTADGRKVLPLLNVMDKLGIEDFLRDVPYFQANMGLKHRINRTTSTPSSTRRKFYGGVKSTKLTTQIIYEDVILFEQRSEVDEDELDTIENAKEARRQEDESHIAGLLEDFVNAMFNDDKASGAEYVDGFKKRTSSLSYPGHSTETLPYCWNMGGSTALSSIYIVEYGPRACHAIYPSGNTVKGSILGIIARNKGKEPKADTDDSTATYYAYVSQFKKWCGLVINDDRKFCRVANIESARAATSGFYEDILIEALNHGRFNRSATRIYVNPHLKTQIDIRAKDKGNVDWGVIEVFGKPISTFQRIPIRVLDDTILTNSEDAVT